MMLLKFLWHISVVSFLAMILMQLMAPLRPESVTKGLIFVAIFWILGFFGSLWQ